VVELAGCLALVLGLRTRPAVLALALFTIAATAMFHNFWAAPDAQVVVRTINFLKNLGLLGLSPCSRASGRDNTPPMRSSRGDDQSSHPGGLLFPGGTSISFGHRIITMTG
jgi:DoxX